MRYGSVCSGIEAATAAWHNLKWEPVWFSEIEPFPCKVLKHHYPDVPNLGDMTKFKDWEDYNLDLIVAGCPCQSFSIAGLRKGIEDPRGNLTFTLLGIIDRYKPQYVVYENVPGLLSIDGGKTLMDFLDALLELGYITDIDILDAQHFGVPQRRKRIFIICQNLKSLTEKKMILSSLITIKLLIEILHYPLACQLSNCATGQKNSVLLKNHFKRSGLNKNLKLLNSLFPEQKDLTSQITSMVNCLKSSIDLLIQYKHSAEEKESLSEILNEEKVSLLTGISKSGTDLDKFKSIEKQWRESLEGLLQVQSGSIMLMEINSTTNQQIYTCAKTIANTFDYIISLNPSAINLLDEELLNLITIKEYTKYARQSNSELFGAMGWSDQLTDIIQSSKNIECLIKRHLGNDWRPPFAVLFERESLRRDFEASAKARQKASGKVGGNTKAASWHDGSIAPTIDASYGRLQGQDNQHIDSGAGLFVETKNSAFNFEMYSGECNEVSPCLQKDRAGDTLVYPEVQCFGAQNSHHQSMSVDDVSPSLDKSKVPAICIQGSMIGRDDKNGPQGNGINEEVAFTLNATDRHAITIDSTFSIQTSQTGANGSNISEEVSPSLTKNDVPAVTQRKDEISCCEQSDTITKCPNQTTGSQGYFAATGSLVRRLTPLECERLQGFPDNYTNIPGAKDSPRYSSIGNSMAVHVMKWLGSRIDKVNNILKQISQTT